MGRYAIHIPGFTTRVLFCVPKTLIGVRTNV